MCSTIENNAKTAVQSPKNETAARSIICRICFDNESGTDRLIRPCSCSGTVAFVHNGCLERWVRATSNIQCTICQDDFELTPAGLKNWGDITVPRPLSDECEDYVEFGCTLAWMVYMIRFGYIGLRYGGRSMIDTVDETIGTGALRSLWWFSFWFNFLYYGAMSFILYEKWLLENTVFSFKDR
ncbi:unnamed protein product [Caenorhabditis sp. 36 PRJEB53466]|nr:unnamed protein product [Caenorhabditis sp. 36 PRJEB53466]